MRPDVARSIAARKSHPEAERELRHCRRHGITPLASTDDAYPALLREIPDYPHVLYIKGNAEVLSQRCLSMVGTRRISTYGQRLCDELVRGLTRIPQVVVVSGLGLRGGRGLPSCGVGGRNPDRGRTGKPAARCDTGRAHLRSARHDRTGRGADFGTPLAEQTAGNVLPRTQPHYRRIECRHGSHRIARLGGSLATAHYADGYDRTVMAPPGRTTDANSFGTNSLIRNRKALLIRSADDIAEELQWEFALSRDEKTAPAPTPELTAEEREVLSLLGDEPRTLAELIAASGRDYAALSVLLMGLELSQAVRQLPGNRYERFR